MVVAFALTSPTPAPLVASAAVAVPVVAAGKRDQWHEKVRDGYAEREKNVIYWRLALVSVLCCVSERSVTRQLLELLKK